MARLTRGQFLDMLKLLDPDPQFLTKIIVETFKLLPQNYAWQLSQQLYLEYFYDGPKITLTNHITGAVRQFTSTEEIVSYLRKLGYKATRNNVSSAIKRRAGNYMNHQFDREEKEPTYFE